MADADFTESIKKWVQLDNQVKAYNDKARQLREERNDIADSIIEYVDTSGLNNTTVKISDGKLRFAHKANGTFDLRYVEDCFTNALVTRQLLSRLWVTSKNREVSV